MFLKGDPEISSAMEKLMNEKTRGLEVLGLIDQAGREYIVTIHHDVPAEERFTDEIIEVFPDGTSKTLVIGHVWRVGGIFMGVPAKAVVNQNDATIVTRISASREITTISTIYEMVRS